MPRDPERHAAYMREYLRRRRRRQRYTAGAMDGYAGADPQHPRSRVYMKGYSTGALHRPGGRLDLVRQAIFSYDGSD